MQKKVNIMFMQFVRDLQERESLAVRRVRALRAMFQFGDVNVIKMSKSWTLSQNSGFLYTPYTTDNVQPTSKEKHACTCTNKVHQELKYTHQNA